MRKITRLSGVCANNRAAIGGFSPTGPGTAACYRRASKSNAWEVQRFADERQDNWRTVVHLCGCAR